MNDAAWSLNDLETFVRSRPLVALGGAGVAGMALGGLILPRMGRFFFLAVAAYVGRELWQRQTQRGVDEIAGAPRRPPARATTPK